MLCDNYLIYRLTILEITNLAIRASSTFVYATGMKVVSGQKRGNHAGIIKPQNCGLAPIGLTLSGNRGKQLEVSFNYPCIDHIIAHV